MDTHEPLIVAPAGVQPAEPAILAEPPTAWVYLLCFAHNPYKHAQHYLGMTTLGVEERIRAHRGETEIGRPAKLLAALGEAGGTFVVADIWDCLTRKDAYALERQLKRIGNGRLLCSICNPGNRRGTGLVGRRRKELAQVTP